MSSRKQTSIAPFFGEARRDKQHPPSKFRRKTGSSFGRCPLCHNSLPWHQLEFHASSCEGPPAECAKTQPGKQSSKRKRPEEEGRNSSTPALYLTPTTEPIPGLFVFENFITPEEEKAILEELDGSATSQSLHENNSKSPPFLPWKASAFNGTHYGKRWGVHCNLRDKMVSEPEHPLPSFLTQSLIPKLKQVKAMKGCVPNEANAIDYRRQLGHDLTAHVDDRRLSKEPIANLSLAGDCYMTFGNIAPQRNTAVSHARVWLPRRCLQIMTKQARYDFTHAISNGDLHSDRRVSITLRESPLTKSMAAPDKSPAMAATWWNVPSSKKLPPSIRLAETLTPTAQPIPGLFLFEDFISEEEEESILRELDDHQKDPKWKLETHSGRHCEKRFGVDHDLWNRHQIRKPKYPLPDFMLQILLPRFRNIGPMKGCIPNEVNAISYRRNQGHSLDSHVDDRQKHKEPIANLSLAGDCVMMFQNVGRGLTTTTNPDAKRVLLKRRCLQVMTGKARYEYAHGIENSDLQSERRVSVTMRETPM